MTYAEYKKETYDNCKKALSDVAYDDLMDLELLKKLLWEDDRVTGVASGHCTSRLEKASDGIEDILFDREFLSDFNRNGLNMQRVIAYGPDGIDVAARCMALSYVNVLELARAECERRDERERQIKSCSVRV